MKHYDPARAARYAAAFANERDLTGLGCAAFGALLIALEALVH